MSPRIYADYAATAPLRPEVREALFSLMQTPLGNPSSIHAAGREAKHLLEEARRQVAALINASADEIIFTSGGTEANNLALKGLCPGVYRRLLTTSTEHLSVLQSAKALASQGVEVCSVPVDAHGMIQLEALESLLAKGPAVVSVAYVNNETGNLAPIDEISKVVKARGGVLHVDAVQAAAYLHPEPARAGVDLLSLSAHKLGALPGVGALYVKKGLKLQPTMTGGHQENETRGGTENLFGVIAFGVAAKLALQEKGASYVRLRDLRDRLLSRVLEKIPEAFVNGHPLKRAPHIASVRFARCDGQLTLIHLDLAGICASSGSACATGQLSPSHVLLAMGLSEEDAKSAVRFSFGYATTEEEIEKISEALPAIIAQVRAF